MCGISLYSFVRARSPSAAILCSLLFLTVAGDAFADQSLPPRVTASSSNNGKYVFRVTPRELGKHKYGTCRGVLLVKNGNELKPLWSRPLVNNTAPVFAYVCDSGQYVVTISEWAQPDLLPVVFYGWKGELVNSYGSLDQILPEALGGYRIGDPTSFERRLWLASGLFFFEPNDEYFIIRLWTGKVCVFETRRGRLLDEKDEQWHKFFSDREEDQRKGRLREREDQKKKFGPMFYEMWLKKFASEQKEDQQKGLLCETEDERDKRRRLLFEKWLDKFVSDQKEDQRRGLLQIANEKLKRLILFEALRLASSEQAYFYNIISLLEIFGF